jgi:hypothetical protein
MDGSAEGLADEVEEVHVFFDLRGLKFVDLGD